MLKEKVPTRARILSAAARLFAERGYHAVGMTEIQDAVALKRGALYHHIRSKEDLLYDISRQYISELLLRGQHVMKDVRDPRERVRVLGRDLILKIASHQAELIVCFREVHALGEERYADVMKSHVKYEKLWRDTFAEGSDIGCFRPFDSIVLKGMLGMYFYSYLWIRPGGPQGPSAIADRLNELALRMLAADAASIATPLQSRKSEASSRARSRSVARTRSRVD